MLNILGEKASHPLADGASHRVAHLKDPFAMAATREARNLIDVLYVKQMTGKNRGV